LHKQSTPGRRFAGHSGGNEVPSIGTAGGIKEQLEFSDPASCSAWLARLPLANISECHAALARQVNGMADADVPASVKLELLELMRGTIGRVQAQQAQRYIGRPVPLDDDERAVWESVLAVSLSMAAAYDGLIDAMARSSPEIAADAALICQRALRYTGLAMMDHNLSYRTVPAALWRQLHRLYVFAETAGVEATPIHDAIGRATTTTSCAGTYIHALLMQFCQPDAMDVQQISAVERWLDAWENLVTLSPSPPAGSAIPAIAVDLASDGGARLAHDLPSTDARHLNLESLSKALRQAAATIKRGQAPEGIELGRLSPAAAEKLLLLLHIQWCAAGTGRVDERSTGGIIVTIAPHLPAIHYQIAGQPFQQPGAQAIELERQGEKIPVSADGTDRVLVSQRSGTVETWIVLNKSASGFLGMCHDPSTATHIGYNQLLGLRNPTNRNMYLGTVQRLIVDEAGAIWIGLRLITGTPQAVAVRVLDARGPDAGKYDRAVLIPEDVARKSPASILLMPGWYAAKRSLDLHTGKAQRITLHALLDKGPNFERATFAAS
jgi:cyclic-di-GMP-binding protein